MNYKPSIDKPVPYALPPFDPDQPIPYRACVLTASPELRTFVVPKLGIQPVATTTVPVEEPKSETRLKVA